MFDEKIVDKKVQEWLITSQNLATFVVFFGLLCSEFFSWLLYQFPASELLWRLSMPLHKLTSPFLDVIHAQLAPSAPEIFFYLLIICSIPLISIFKKSMLITAVSTHLALLISASLYLRHSNNFTGFLESASLDEATIARVSQMSPESQIFRVAVVILLTLSLYGHCVFYIQNRHNS